VERRCGVVLAGFTRGATVAAVATFGLDVMGWDGNSPRGSRPARRTVDPGPAGCELEQLAQAHDLAERTRAPTPMVNPEQSIGERLVAPATNATNGTKADRADAPRRLRTTGSPLTAHRSPFT
jgi:hypothetical protein